ncbi:transposase [Streptomyces sp. H27-H1]|uniref:transposase n=1 Tax=Streptomyces sp. H27-H1 TaxID=2996461 RepID=UPI00226FA3EA|nr:transposase [Streptomyces sp. H27-H1]MCY0932172.1 transposase [Streptomyces sp. H27-H1]
MATVLSPETIDGLVADARESGMGLDGAGGLLGQMMKAVLERDLRVEMADHLGYEAGDRVGRGSGNHRNGSFEKTVTTTAGDITVDVPRDRNGEFTPVVVPKGRRRLGQIDEMILSLYARGMSTRDITAHLAEVYGATVSPALISKVTDVIADEVIAWQNRPVDEWRFPPVVANQQ